MHARMIFSSIALCFDRAFTTGVPGGTYTLISQEISQVKYIFLQRFNMLGVDSNVNQMLKEYIKMGYVITE